MSGLGTYSIAEGKALEADKARLEARVAELGSVEASNSYLHGRNAELSGALRFYGRPEAYRRRGTSAKPITADCGAIALKALSSDGSAIMDVVKAQQRLSKSVASIRIGTRNHWAPPHCMDIKATSGPAAEEFLHALADWKQALDRLDRGGDDADS